MNTPVEANSSISQHTYGEGSQKASSFMLERLSGIATWLVVSVSSIGLMATQNNSGLGHLLLAGFMCLTYLGLWVYAVTGNDNGSPSVTRKIAIVALFFVVLGIYFVIPYSFVAIFMVIFSAITPYFMSTKRAFLLSPLWSLPLYLIYSLYWQQSGVVITTFLFWTFNLFALVMVNTSLREREARHAAETATRELAATQSLLNEAVKQGERVRIARNIHDLLGHHLTALTINLQVASRKSEGEVKASIEQCHQLAKLLLSDVREAVSDIRDKGKLDLRASISTILASLPSIKAEFDFDNKLNISDIHIADTIVKCVQESITNTLKHAHGKHICVGLRYSNANYNEIELRIQNDGNVPSNIIFGNGLSGIKERIDELKGRVEFSLKQGAFITHIHIPVPQDD